MEAEGPCKRHKEWTEAELVLCEPLCRPLCRPLCAPFFILFR